MRRKNRLFLPLLCLLSLGYATLVGCGAPSTQPTTDKPTLATKRQKIGADTYPTHTDALIDKLQTTHSRADTLLAQFVALDTLLANTLEVTTKAHDAADYIVKAHQYAGSAITTLQAFTAIPNPVGSVASTLKTLLSNFKNTTLDPIEPKAKSARSKLKSLNNKLNKIRDQILKHIINNLTKLRDSAQSHREHLRFLKNCIDDLSGSARSDAEDVVDTYAYANKGVVQTLNDALAAVTLNQYNLDTLLPDLQNLLNVPNNLFNALVELDGLFSPLQGFFDQLNNILDMDITVNISPFGSFTFSVRDILDGLSLVTEVLDALWNEAMKLLDPVLDALGIDLPSLPGLSNFMDKLDDFFDIELTITNPLDSLDIHLTALKLQFEGFYVDLRGLFGSLNIGNFCDDDWKRVVEVKLGGMCVAANSQANGSVLRTKLCDKSKKARRWSYYPFSHELRTPGKQRCVEASSSSAGSTLKIKDCNGSSLQKWSYRAASRSFSLIGGGGLCFQVDALNTVDDQIKLRSCNLELDKQQHSLHPFDPENALEEPIHRFQLQQGGKCLKKGSSNGQPIGKIATCEQINKQKWRYSPLTGNLRSVADPNLCAAASSIIGQPGLKLYPCAPGPGQSWFWTGSQRLSVIRSISFDPVAGHLAANTENMFVPSANTSTDGSEVLLSSASGSNATWIILNNLGN